MFNIYLFNFHHSTVTIDMTLFLIELVQFKNLLDGTRPLFINIYNSLETCFKQNLYILHEAPRHSHTGYEVCSILTPAHQSFLGLTFFGPT